MNNQQRLSYIEYCKLKDSLAMNEMKIKRENLQTRLDFIAENLLSDVIQKHEYDLVKEELKLLECEFNAMF